MQLFRLYGFCFNRDMHFALAFIAVKAWETSASQITESIVLVPKMVAMRFHCCCKSSSRLELWKLIKNEMASGGSTFEYSAVHLSFKCRFRKQNLIEIVDLIYVRRRTSYAFLNSADFGPSGMFAVVAFTWISLNRGNAVDMTKCDTQIQQSDGWNYVTSPTVSSHTVCMGGTLCTDSLELCYDTCTFALVKRYAKK